MCRSRWVTCESMTLAVTLASESIFAAHYSEDRADLFYHSSSYTANPIACAAAAANLAIWREEDVLGGVAGLGQAMGDHLDRIAHHPAFENARRIGAVAAIEDRKSTRLNSSH